MTQPSALAGIGLMVLGIFLFCCNDALGKWLLGTYSVWQMLAIRSAAAMLLLAPLLWREGRAVFEAPRPWLQFARVMLSVVESIMFFIAVTYLPLADTVTFYLAAPIYVTALSALFLKEQVGWRRWSAVAAGFVGVLVIVQPGSGEVPITGAAMALVAALMTAAVTIMIRRLGATERASTTVFWFAVSSLVPMAVLMLWFARSHDPQTWAIIAGLALAGGLAQLTLTGALRLAPVALVMPMDYTSLLWATLLGMWLFAELPTPWVWVGAPIIIASGLVIVWREHRLHRRAALAAQMTAE
jgi:drug/metabolite transporter (DMT)-like permease